MKKFKDFIQFSNEQIISKDIDPVYFILKEVNKRQGLSLEQSIWRCLLYISWYKLSSSEQVFAAYPFPEIIKQEIILPTGVERRGCRGNNKAVEMINGFLTLNSIEKVVDIYKSKNGEEGWNFIREHFETVKGNGNWSSYKWADLMKSVCDFDIKASDIGGNGNLKHSPVKCLTILYEDLGIEGISKKDLLDNKRQREFFELCKEQGAIFGSIDQMETSLCDFKNVLNGKYYAGKDIDEISGYIDDLPEIFKEVFFDEFDEKYNGLKGGWKGVRKEKILKYE